MAIIYQVPQATALIFERMGRFNRIARAGLRFRLPVLDAPKALPGWSQGVRDHHDQPILIELSEQQTDTQPRTIITRDNVEMMADASVFWQIVDPIRAVYEVDNLPRSVTDLAVTTLRNLLGALTLNDALGARGQINEGLLGELEATGRKWGVRVNRVEVQELRAANPEASGAMLQQMASERDREARVARAEGERRARRLRAEGTAAALRTLVDADLEIYDRAAAGMGPERAFRYLLTLKYLETLERVADSPSTTIVLPSSTPDPLLVGAIDGLRPRGPRPLGDESATSATHPSGDESTPRLPAPAATDDAAIATEPAAEPSAAPSDIEDPDAPPKD